MGKRSPPIPGAFVYLYSRNLRPSSRASETGFFESMEQLPLCSLPLFQDRRAGEWLWDDVRQLKDEGVDILVSLLSWGESRELDLDEEKAACSSVGMSFVNFPIPDRMVPPSRFAFLTFAQFLSTSARE